MSLTLTICAKCNHENVYFFDKVIDNCDCDCHFRCSFCGNEVCYQDELRSRGVVRVLAQVDGRDCEAQVCKLHYDESIMKHQPDIRCDIHSIWHPANKDCKECINQQ